MEGRAFGILLPRVLMCSMGSPTSILTPMAAATAMASRAQPRATPQAFGSAITPPMVSPVVTVVPENVTFMISFSQTMRWIPSNRLTLKPDDCHMAAEACRRCVGRPLKAPKRIISRPLWWAWPGPRMDAPKPPTTPTAILSLPRMGAAASGEPRPFWMVCTTVSGPIRDTLERAAASTSNALVAMITRSQTPIPSVVTPELASRTVRSPLAPSTRRPFLAMASAWSGQVVTA